MPSDYRTSGVDIEAGAEAVRRILPHVRSTFGPETVSDIGGFGGVFDLVAMNLPRNSKYALFHFNCLDGFF